MFLPISCLHAFKTEVKHSLAGRFFSFSAEQLEALSTGFTDLGASFFLSSRRPTSDFLGIIRR